MIPIDRPRDQLSKKHGCGWFILDLVVLKDFQIFLMASLWISTIFAFSFFLQLFNLYRSILQDSQEPKPKISARAKKWGSKKTMMMKNLKNLPCTGEPMSAEEQQSIEKEYVAKKLAEQLVSS